MTGKETTMPKTPKPSRALADIIARGLDEHERLALQGTVRGNEDAFDYIVEAGLAFVDDAGEWPTPLGKAVLAAMAPQKRRAKLQRQARKVTS